MEFNCASFKDGGEIPIDFTLLGRNISPSFYWDNYPDRTKSLAIICNDIDSPNGEFIHWIMYDIPVGITKIHPFVSSKSVFDNGMKQGINDFGRYGYGGPNPPRDGKEHRYIFKLIALDVFTLEVSSTPNKQDVGDAMQGHIIESKIITGLFKNI